MASASAWDGRRDIVATGPQAGVVSVLLNERATLDARPALPNAELELIAHPNPARGSVTLRLRAPAGATTSLEIFDLAGRSVARLGERTSDGEWNTAAWRGEDSAGARVAPGVYLARLRAGRLVTQERVILLPR